MPEQDLASLTGVQKATSIGPPQPGTRIQPTPGEGPLTTLARWLVGESRPASVVAQDPFGITGWERGAGQPPLMAGTTQGPGEGVMDALAQKFPRLAKVIKAYHGSPHDFEQFDLSKIGTGEGAQAYGHGLYFAEDPATAKYYKNQLSRGFEYQGQTVDPRSSLGRDLDFLNPLRGDESLEEVLLRRIRELREHAAFMRKVEPNYGSDAMYDRAAAALEKLDPKQLKQAGRMYEVAIHADPESFLDWDKPLSQQSEKIKAAIASAYGDVRPVRLKNGRYSVTLVGSDQSGRVLGAIDEATPEAALKTFRESYVPSQSGADAYQDLVRFADRNQSASTEALKRQGIPGIKYLDQGSRAAGEGSRNYVVFDDKIIEIMKKYGVGLAVAQQIYQRQQQEQGK